ncbi:alkaline phosphatase family protein [Roseateles chitinivorans]|uniref:alkaline phosphatase family protein n=1 Tax=Roseateles chitinivorans TaxID=2917965 RepID=UPI003D67DDB5
MLNGRTFRRIRNDLPAPALAEPWRSLMSIQHVVVVLFENRSYDNVLGRLYHPDNLPPYDKAPGGQAHLNGLTDSDSNPCPAGCDNNPCPPGVSTIPVSNQVTPTRIEGSDLWYAATAIPTIDPGEPFCDMAQQLLGLAHKPESNPYVDYPPRDRSRLCQGFTLNYAQQCWGLGNPEAPVPSDNIKDIMNCLTPAQMPVSAFLANRYALSDEWFASVPTQTFTNRAFAMCAAPGQSVNLLGERFSFIDDIQYVFNPLKPVRSVMRQLDEVHGRSVDGVATWKVYFHDYSVAVETVRDVADAARAADNINVASFDDSDWGSHGHPPQIKGAKATTFLHDVKAGKLPKFSFIEPRFFDNYARSHLPANHNHPGVPKYPTHLRGSNAPTDAATGEVFLMQLYNLLRRSPCWADTLLIISYDEHGGVFDHVPPPVAPPRATTCRRCAA